MPPLGAFCVQGIGLSAHTVMPVVKVTDAWRSRPTMSTSLPPIAPDLVTCRNVSIYLDAEAQQRIHFALQPGGHLFHSESSPGSDSVRPCRRCDRRV